MISTETIAEQFEELGLEPSAAILERCMLIRLSMKRTIQRLIVNCFWFQGVHLCVEYSITDAVEFVERWVAFSLTHLNGADPTLDNLNELERKEFEKNSKNANNAKNKSTSNKTDNNSSSYDDFPDDDIMDSYGLHTPKVILFVLLMLLSIQQWVKKLCKCCEERNCSTL